MLYLVLMGTIVGYILIAANLIKETIKNLKKIK